MLTFASYRLFRELWSIFFLEISLKKKSGMERDSFLAYKLPDVEYLVVLVKRKKNRYV